MSGELSDALDTDDDETVALSPDDVAVFLMRNPTFFSDHPDVLDYVELPDRFKAGGVVDFQRYQLQRRESEIDELRTTAQDVTRSTGRTVASGYACKTGEDTPAETRRRWHARRRLARLLRLLARPPAGGSVGTASQM